MDQPDLNTHTHVVVAIDKYDDIQVFGPYTKVGAETMAAIAVHLESLNTSVIRVVKLDDFKL